MSEKKQTINALDVKHQEHYKKTRVQKELSEQFKNERKDHFLKRIALSKINELVSKGKIPFMVSGIVPMVLDMLPRKIWSGITNVLILAFIGLLSIFYWTYLLISYFI